MVKLTEAGTFLGLKVRLVPEKNYDFKEIERINMNTKTREFLKQLFEFIEDLKKIFGDGFQWSDTFATTGLLPKLISMLMKVNDVRAELPLLSKEQIKDLTKEFSAIGLNIFWTNNSLEDEKFGITNIKLLLDELTDVINDVLNASKDGININDLVYLPSVIQSTVSIIGASSSAFEECKHLSALKVSELLVSMLSKIFYLVK